MMYFSDREDLLPVSSGILTQLLVKVTTLNLLFSFLLGSVSFVSSEVFLFSISVSISLSAHDVKTYAVAFVVDSSRTLVCVWETTDYRVTEYNKVRFEISQLY